MSKKTDKKDTEKMPEMSDAEKIKTLTAQVTFFKGLVAERTGQLNQAIETIKAQNKTIETLNASLDAMNKTNELLRRN